MPYCWKALRRSEAGDRSRPLSRLVFHPFSADQGNRRLKKRMLRGVFLISMFLISALLISAVLIAFMDTIFHPATILARCWGRALIEDDVAAIEKVRQHYQSDEATMRLIDENAPLKVHSSHQSGWKKFVPLYHGKGY